MDTKIATFLALHKEVTRRLDARVKTAAIADKRAEQVADNLIARNIIAPEAKIATLQTLRDHARVLAFLDQITARMRPQPLGNPSGGRKLASEILRPGEERESDRVFRQILLGR